LVVIFKQHSLNKMLIAHCTAVQKLLIVCYGVS